ncbi:histidine kinase [Lentzea sp. NPDC051838]|uniref:sensor histidine kinase n=1 Tax=Lentzea sp. NPDC051838 TaxID=3154849 RepID=UPI00343A2B85
MVSGKDVALAAAFLLLSFVPGMSAVAVEIGDLPERPADWLAVVLVVALSVPLAVRTKWPRLCLVVVGLAFVAYQALSYPPVFASLALYVALYTVGVRGRRPWEAVAGYVVLAVVLHLLGSPNRLQDFVLFGLALAGMWFVGDQVRRRRAQAESAERARIARELHDVVTHHVTAMVVQADAAQFVPEKDTAGLAAISSTGRRALSELRHLLGVLEATGEHGRTPAAGEVADLVEQARLAGQPVELTEEGAPRALDLAAYRVVQEALTNALKHAAGQPTTVLVRHGSGHVEIEVVTASPAGAQSDGRGLSGLRERVRTAGGRFEAGPHRAGFRVWARIPV